MRIRDLKWRGLSAWPPEWSGSHQGLDKKGVLKKVCLSQDPEPTFFYIEVTYDGATLTGKIELENPKLLNPLYLVLKKNIGKPLAEIGDLEIEI
jgi:hypothetical protein